MGSPDPETAGPGGGSRSQSPAKRESTGPDEESDPGFMAGFCGFVWKYLTQCCGQLSLSVSPCGYGWQNTPRSTRRRRLSRSRRILLSTDNVCIFNTLRALQGPAQYPHGRPIHGHTAHGRPPGVLFFGIKNIYYYLRPLMAILGLFCIWQGAMVFYQPRQG